MKNMNNNIWIKKIKNNFNYAAGNYSEYCLIQKYFSKQEIGGRINNYAAGC